MSKSISRKDIRSLERAVDARAKGVTSTSRGTEPTLEDELLDMLVSGGPELPSTARLDSLKAAYMQRGAALRRQALEMEPATVRPVKQAHVRAHPVLARVAAITAAVMVLLVGLGFGSAYAMPGNPLYSVKRTAESAYLSLVPGNQSKADAYASWTNRRLDDLKYAEERGMENWYYKLVEDAQEGIENTYQHGKRLRVGASEKVRKKAQTLTLRLEELLRKALGQMTPAEKSKTESRMERLRFQLQMRQGSQSGPSQQNGQPSDQNETPNEPGSQQQQQNQQQQQQNQPTQPESPQQDQGPGGPSQDKGKQEQRSPRQRESNTPSGNRGSTTPGPSGR